MSGGVRLSAALATGTGTVCLSRAQIKNIAAAWRAAGGEGDPLLADALAVILPHRPVRAGRLERTDGDGPEASESRPEIPSRGELSDFCRHHGIEKLALFGSALRDDFSATSDIDLLVEFCPETKIGYFGVARLARALSPLFGGRTIDLRTPAELSPHIRERVLREARALVDVGGDGQAGAG